MACYLKWNRWNSHVSHILNKAPHSKRSSQGQSQRAEINKTALQTCTSAPHATVRQLQRDSETTASAALMHAYYSFWAKKCAGNISCQQAGTVQHQPTTTATSPWINGTTTPRSLSFVFIQKLQSKSPALPQTQKTRELNFQLWLFLSNERHWAPLTNWHLTKKCVTLTTACPVQLSSWV